MEINKKSKLNLISISILISFLLLLLSSCESNKKSEAVILPSNNNSSEIECEIDSFEVKPSNNKLESENSNLRDSNKEKEPEIKKNESQISEINQDIKTQNEKITITNSNKDRTFDFLILKGKVICIDPGHQEKENNEKEPIAPNCSISKEKMSWGTSGVATKIPEYALNLTVALKLKVLFEKYGAKVVMTREVNNIDKSNIERAKAANETGADLIIRIHADGADAATVSGISILYPDDKYLTDKIMLQSSKDAASYVLKEMITSTNAVSRGMIAREDMTGFNWSKLPVILIELGFMTNPEEDKRLNSSDYQDKLITGIVKGVTRFLANKVH